MQTYTKGPAAGWSWLVQGFAAYRHAPGALLGASAVMVVCTGILLGIQLVIERGTAPDAARLVTAMVVMLIVFGVVYPILIGGFMRIVHAARSGQPARAGTVLQPFRPGQGGGRLALFGVCMLVLYVAFFALVLGTVGRGLLRWYAALVAAQSAGAPLESLPALPAGSGVAFALLTVFLIFYSAALAIGIGQVALRGERPWPAFRDGLAGAFKNVLPLLVLTVCGLIVLLLVLLVLGILMAILGLLVHAFGGAAAATIAVFTVVETILALAAYPVVIGIQVALWHDVTGGVPTPAAPPADLVA